MELYLVKIHFTTLGLSPIASNDGMLVIMNRKVHRKKLWPNLRESPGVCVRCLEETQTNSTKSQYVDQICIWSFRNTKKCYRICQ